MTTFIEESGLGDAFLGNRLLQAADLIVEQGEALLREAGLSIPARASSTILLVSERGGVSTADIARELVQPHQLATQRVEALIELGLLKRRADPQDGRRKILVLTAKGEKEAAILYQTLQYAQAAFQTLYDEIGVDLGEACARAMQGLTWRPLSSRIGASKQAGRRTGRREKARV